VAAVNSFEMFMNLYNAIAENDSNEDDDEEENNIVPFPFGIFNMARTAFLQLC
jgi:hypothetical protein